MSCTRLQAMSEVAADLQSVTGRIDEALDSGDREEFHRACADRKILLAEIMTELHSRGLVFFR